MHPAFWVTLVVGFIAVSTFFGMICWSQIDKNIGKLGAAASHIGLIDRRTYGMPAEQEWKGLLFAPKHKRFFRRLIFWGFPPPLQINQDAHKALSRLRLWSLAIQLPFVFFFVGVSLTLGLGAMLFLIIFYFAALLLANLLSWSVPWSWSRQP